MSISLRFRRHFWIFVFVCLSLWYAAASQTNSVTYLFLFVLLSIFVLSVPFTILNLSKLSVTVFSPAPFFCGENISCKLSVSSISPRHVLDFSIPSFAKIEPLFLAHLALSDSFNPRPVDLLFPSLRRGLFEVTSVEAVSSFPFGLLEAFRVFPISFSVLVYPTPVGTALLPPPVALGSTEFSSTSKSLGDDYSGSRPYMHGDRPRHIDWKAVARGLPLLTKQFSAGGGSRI